MHPTRHPDLSGIITILVVDDIAEVRRFCQTVLQQAGYRTFEASDGVEAMEILQRLDHPVDLVLTDLIMPRLNGIALGERLAKIYPDTPVLYMSGYIEALLSKERIPNIQSCASLSRQIAWSPPSRISFLLHAPDFLPRRLPEVDPKGWTKFCPFLDGAAG